MRRMSSQLTAALADLVNQRNAVMTLLYRYRGVAKREDQLNEEDDELIDQHGKTLLAIRDELIAEGHKIINPTTTEPSDLMGLPQDMGQRIVSIQVQTTRLTGAGVEIVGYKDQHIKPTHWSIYKRNAKGEAQWIEDIGLQGNYTAAAAFGDVMVKAAKYSIMYQAFIEEPK